jgi:hypothetical protein
MPNDSGPYAKRYATLWRFFKLISCGCRVVVTLNNLLARVMKVLDNC